MMNLRGCTARAYAYNYTYIEYKVLTCKEMIESIYESI